jgi:hypothetical protein
MITVSGGGLSGLPPLRAPGALGRSWGLFVQMGQYVVWTCRVCGRVWVKKETTGQRLIVGQQSMAVLTYITRTGTDPGRLEPGPSQRWGARPMRPDMAR